MSKTEFNFNVEQFSRLFPFYILINGNLKIESVGKSLEKICTLSPGQSFTELFNVKRPEQLIERISDFDSLINELVILESKDTKKIVIRGQFECLEPAKQYLFVGTPWFGSMDQVRTNHLTLLDFALHDPMTDLLHVLKTKEITTDEIKQLLKTVNAQKNKLKLSEENYRTIVEMATDIIYKSNLEGYFTYVNDVAERITGFSREELLKMRYLQLIRNNYKRKAFEFYRNQILNKITTTYFEFPIITKQGKEIWIGQSVQYPQHESSSNELTALAIDISERKNAEHNLVLQEEKYRNIIANMNLGLLEVDKDEIIQYANQSFCNMSGYTLEELRGKKALGLFLDEKEMEVMNQKNEIRRDGISDMYSLPVLNKKGEKRWWVISGAPRFNDNGDLVGSVGIHLDVTDQKHLEEELKIAKHNAEASSKAKESFLATMSHEIRTPLNAIIGMTDLMHLNTKARSHENLDILRFSARNLLALITDILDLSKIEAGKIELAKNPVDLKQIIQGVFHAFRPACEEKNLELILNIDKSVPEIILGDELRLSQILNNLISNAVKFTPKGYIKINVEGLATSSDKIRVFFKVSDTGIGIKKSKVNLIFRAFEQADHTIVRQFGGTGLGLNITKKLIELQGGKIKVESSLNKGSEFSFYIDYEISKSKKKQEEAIANTKQGQKILMKNKTVLLVEDNIANQKVAVSYFNHWGLNYDVANHGAEALDMLKKKQYDLALIDLYMPVMDGFETIKRMRKIKVLKGIPVIALTASAEVSLMDKAMMLGANKCLTKPFNAQQLRNTILDLLKLEIAAPEEIKQKKTGITKGKYKFIDLKNIKEASLGSKQFIAEMLALLSQEIPGLIHEAESLFGNAEYDRFSKVIHKMKNNLLMIGVETLRDDLRFMEEQAKSKSKSAQVKTAFERLKIVWSKALPELEDAKSIGI